MIYLGDLFKSWFFFTALLLFLLAASAAIPELGNRLFGRTEAQIQMTADYMESQVQQVWTQIKP